MALKYNKVRVDGQAHQFSGFLFTADIVNARDEFTKAQHFLLLNDFHARSIKTEIMRAAYGVFTPCANSALGSEPEAKRKANPQPQGRGSCGVSRGVRRFGFCDLAFLGRANWVLEFSDGFVPPKNAEAHNFRRLVIPPGPR